jgi:hypothetical protein
VEANVMVGAVAERVLKIEAVVGGDLRGAGDPQPRTDHRADQLNRPVDLRVRDGSARSRASIASRLPAGTVASSADNFPMSNVSAAPSRASTAARCERGTPSLKPTTIRAAVPACACTAAEQTPVTAAQSAAVTDQKPERR